MGKLIKMGKNGSLGITIPKDVCRKLELTPDDDEVFVEVELNVEENDIDNQDMLRFKVGWVKLQKSGLAGKL